ncbi:uncharacterized protein ATNIH1004_002368 [Aspergillus tanneri]|uniref:Uncharacterized protein n=1 Tax=Aspergillus tanneri TaxID=1220188 RepID=A0A5M9MRK2_9EURO|nr:uncharacterized protein ATNIH1004_002368 [Aspergillus tanneri]KAA8649695.1 hypothetical protein ATNIH1004_002368 [Aspergillus tanneri]
MSLRQKVRRVFHRSGSGSKVKGNGIKIEYYKRHEIPRSKFKGPFDREHQKRLAAWSFKEAQADRPRQFDLSLSPCATLPDYLKSSYEEDDEDVAPDQIRTTAPEITLADEASIEYHRETGSGSSSSTAVDPESYSSSLKTLLPDVLQQDSIAQIKSRCVTRRPLYEPSRRRP